MKNSRVLIAGGTGFIGERLVAELFRSGVKEAVVLHKNPEYKKNDYPAEYVSCDLSSKESEPLVRGLGGFDYVFNLVGKTDQRMPHPNPDELLAANVLTLVHLTNAILWEKVKGAVHVGSNAEYGNASLPHIENGEVRPANLYGWSKVMATDYAHFSARCGFAKWAIARPFFVCGQGQRAGFLAELASMLKDGKEFVVRSAQATRDLVLVDDVAQGLIRLAQSRKASGEIVNICSGKEVTMAEIAVKARDIIGSGSVVLKNESRPGDFMRSCGSNDKLERLTGWKPATSLDDILKSTLN